MQYGRDIAISGGQEAQQFSITYHRLRKGFVFVWYGQESKAPCKTKPKLVPQKDAVDSGMVQPEQWKLVWNCKIFVSIVLVAIA